MKGDCLRTMLTKKQIEELALNDRYWFAFNNNHFDYMAFATDLLELQKKTEIDTLNKPYDSGMAYDE